MILPEKTKNHNPNCQQIHNHPCRILIIGGSGAVKTDALLHLISHQPDVDKSYLYVKDPFKVKYQLLIKKCKSVGLKHYNDSKAFIEDANDMDDIYENIEKYNLRKIKYWSYLMI